MLIVGERINTSRPKVGPAVEARDASFIQDMALKQAQAGASMIDVNAGTLVNEEPEALVWLVNTVQEVVDVPLCIDSPNPVAIEAALKACRKKAMVSSVTAEKERYEKITPLVKEYGASIVALCMDESGVPDSAKDRIAIAERLVADLTRDGIPREDIYLDVMVRPVSVSARDGIEALETTRGIMQGIPGVHTICGLSNVSFGLPLRKLLNRAFLCILMGAGLDSAILDPLDREIMAAIYAAEALLGKDEFCMNYIAANRDGKLSV
ncbi:MAG TPA: methyltetrahydrofolate cobalamin methyltransferase [Firmicutes bacterium]|nr:methyltetrahydrofolate cobalamin methyltransferase [Bacillota bacterium]